MWCLDDKGFMKLKDIQNHFQNELNSIFEKEEIDTFFFMLIDSFYDVSRLKLAMEPGLEIKTENRIINALESLKKEKPIQYILGKTEFFGLPFKVNKDVLIPRPETEELLEWVINSVASRAVEKSLNILDIGTGSGCIAISLAKNLPKAKIYALDVSKEALKVAKQNAVLNNVEIEFVEADVLKLEDGILKTEDVRGLEFENLKFDVIVSNPPYVQEQEKQQMKPNVLNNEPHLALFVKDENPLLFYEVIADFAEYNLKENGILFFEINEYLGNKTMQLLKEKQFKNLELKQDIFKKDRMVKGEINL